MRDRLLQRVRLLVLGLDEGNECIFVFINNAKNKEKGLTLHTSRVKGSHVVQEQVVFLRQSKVSWQKRCEVPFPGTSKASYRGHTAKT